MADESTAAPTRNSSGLMSAVLWFGLIFAVYVLSIGPVARFYDRSKRPPPQALKTFYAPLGATYENFRPAKVFFDWYAHLWGTHL
ncbi:MAG: hypothetical protein RLY20_2357 [Verrucomicrobiota bacterium]|jgi:hypothetical protein